jgi:hypothetical protein
MEQTLEIFGKRINAWTNERRLVKLQVYLEYHASLESWWIHIKNGVTGYESIQVDRLLEVEKSWYACAGTPKRWDTLIIPQDQIKEIIGWLDTQSFDIDKIESQMQDLDILDSEKFIKTLEDFRQAVNKRFEIPKDCM